MVCQKCEKKLQAVIVPDVWKDGARNTIESGGRKIADNRLLSRRPEPAIDRSAARAARSSSSSSAAVNPYSRRCRICQGPVSQQLAFYCQNCAYEKGSLSLSFSLESDSLF